MTEAETAALRQRVSDKALESHIEYYKRHDGLACNIALDLRAARERIAELQGELREAQAEVWRLEAGLERLQVATGQLLMGGTFEVETEGVREVGENA